MDERISIDDDDRLEALVDRAARGEQIVLTRDGAAVGKIVATPKRNRADALAAVEEMTRLRRGITLGDISIRDLVTEGRKY